MPREPEKSGRSIKGSETPQAGSATTTNGYPAHTLTDLLADLSTLCRNTIRIGHAEHTLTRLTTPTPLQTRALELLDITLHQ